MFVVLDGEDAVGGIGWWQMEWEGDPSVETGWFVLPRAQGRGVATAAVRLIIQDAAEFAPAGCHLYAFPSMWNVPSNALCVRAGFELTGQHDFPFRSQVLHVNAWKHTLASVKLSAGPHDEVSLPMSGNVTPEHLLGPVVRS